MHLKLKISFLMFLSLLDSCIRSQILILGQIIHQHLLKRSLTLTSSTVLVKLTRLYASCNEVKLARHAFDEIIHPRTNPIPWDVMIRSYVSNDHPEKGLDLLHVEELMNVPAGWRRRYHDDVTVMVITFGTDQRTSKASPFVNHISRYKTLNLPKYYIFGGFVFVSFTHAYIEDDVIYIRFRFSPI
ncbi:hypothetical protein YC2023_012370 [Brassica napus]